MRIVGPSAAAFLVGAFGAKICYEIDSLSFIVSGSLIATLALVLPKKSAVVPTREQQELSALRRVVTDMQQGAHFILHHAALLFVILAMSAGMFVIGCFGPLIAVYVRDSVHATTTVYGWASAMIGVGMLIGVNGLNTWGTKIRNTTLVYAGLLGIAFGILILCLITYIWSTLLGDFLIGCSVACIVIPAQTLMQQETPPELMGRVGSTFMSCVFSAQILGLLLSGALAQFTSVRNVFAICAGMLVLLTLAGKLFMEPKAAS
jgi:MFS family permease